jgi:hypothetical protein
MFYSPAREIVNEWDTFARIANEFIQFIEIEGGNKFEIMTLFKFIKEQIEVRARRGDFVSGEWNVQLATIETIEGPQFPEIVDEAMQKSEGYIFYKFEVSQNEIFHQFLYESWEIGPYITVRIQGTGVDYTVMVHKYANEEKIERTVHSIYEILAAAYMREDSIISLYQIKKTVFETLEHLSKEMGIPFEEKIVDDGKEDLERDAHQENQDSIHSKKNDFIFNIYCDRLESTYSVYGFIHGLENVPVVNLFFSTIYFKAEYMIPLNSISLFSANLLSLIKECYTHLVELIFAVTKAEDPGLTDEESDALKKEGRYTFFDVKETILEMLKKRMIYGCITDNTNNQEELAMGLGAEVETRYKWTKDREKDFDYTGMLVIRRSNQRFNDDPDSRCVKSEQLNPIIIKVYPTNLESSKPGYSVHINGLNTMTGERVDFVYFFVKYQDYEHKKIFRSLIYRAIEKITVEKATADDDELEEDGEKIEE